MNILDILVIALLSIGLFFNFIAAIGLHRFPDVYSRLHAATKTNTYGSIFLVLAVVVFAIQNYLNGAQAGGQIQLAVHSLIALVAILIANPTSSHAIARASHRSGYLPKGIVDAMDTGITSTRENKETEEENEEEKQNGA
ncbi:monovalent cation/H(+) antiporter subunit G [Methanonatronarchaeum sp. AMET6-2]|uniref:monovalent cation/H(+) antiporter subunit G n=1 Tax=Methanonatronarchaeum sp. AMET6-2 TaxID=2933293 RepID=UPI0012017CC2|nr:monovalent cation/H(+) antiporter subunit G [Methanonatronarchaeum sp. AMET6-2]RZN61157.1 MAG: cation:proton antiporter [Methanonatronarchaeia archaeon]UOY09784.1 monovalent cation/H(+) antiporter subunit G [Methanonatronarchaeum sp. AMET6-2]